MRDLWPALVGGAGLFLLLAAGFALLSFDAPGMALVLAVSGALGYAVAVATLQHRFIRSFLNHPRPPRPPKRPEWRA